MAMETPQKDVYSKIVLVSADLAKEGIAKTSKNQQQGYNFRGIDSVYNALAPVMARHGLCILPRVLSRECVERQTGNGKAIFYVTVDVEFDFIAASDGSKHTIKTYGEAMDSADKATNKAMSAAYKYAAMQAFCIPTEGDNDADATTHDVVANDETLISGWRNRIKNAPTKDAVRVIKDEIYRQCGQTQRVDLWNIIKADITAKVDLLGDVAA